MRRIIVLPPSLKLLPAFILRQTSWRTCLALAAAITALCASPVGAQKIVQITDLHVTGTSSIGGYDWNGQNFQKTMNYLRDNVVPDFVIATGDLVNSGMQLDNAAIDESNWHALVDKLYKNGNTYYIKKADGTQSTIPVFFVPGNHDDRTIKQTSLFTRNMAGYDAHIPRLPTAPSGYVIGQNGSERDYYIKKGNLIVFCMYSGTDVFPYSSSFKSPEGGGLTAGQISFINNTITANPGLCNVVAMHHPYVNPDGDANVGTNYSGDKFPDAIPFKESGCIFTQRAEFLAAMQKDMSGSFQVRMVLSGHLHQNVVLDRDGIKRDAGWRNAPVYVQTAEGFNGAYRVINVTDRTTYTINAPQRAPNMFPGPKFAESCVNAFVWAGNILIAPVQVAAMDAITKVALYMDGVYQGEKTTPPYNFTVVPNFAAKSTECKLEATAYNAVGAATTSVIIQKAQGADSRYQKMNEGDAVYVKDPLSGNTLPVVMQYVDVDGNGARYASVSVNGSNNPVKAGEMIKVSNTGLFIYVPSVFTGDVGYRFAELMIAPYQYPSIDILLPLPGISTNSNIVQVAVNYSGKNIPWNGVGSPPVRTRDLKTITYGASSTVSETYVWSLSGSNGPRTLTVTLTDRFGTSVSKSVTVNYDASKPFYAYRGPLGESWTGRSWSFTTCEDGDPVFYFHYWDAAGTNNHTIHNEYCTNGGYMGHPGAKEEMITLIAQSLNFPLSKFVPGGATSVYIVDKNEYLEASVSTPVGVIPYYAIYDRLAYMQGKDINGNYRVWYGTKPDHSDAVPIPALHLPVPPAPTYSNIQKTSVQINWANLEGEAGYQLQKSTTGITGPWTTIASPGIDVTNYTDATLSAGTNYWYRVIGVAYSPCTNQTGMSSQVTSMSLSGIINGDFQGVGGWPEPYSRPRSSGMGWSYGGTKFEILTGGPYGKYGRLWVYGGITGQYISDNISQTFTVPLDALIFQFRKHGGSATLNNVAITPDINSWGLSTYDISSKRGQSVTFNISTAAGDGSSECLFDEFTIIGTPPTVAITSPAAGAAVAANKPTTITATALDLAGINRVEFFANDVYIGQSTTSPYTCTWTPASAKTYTLRAVAYDNCGNSSVATGYNGIVNGDFEGTGGWPAPYSTPRSISGWAYGGTLFEIKTDGPYGKYGRSYVYNGMQGEAIANDIWQTFMVPLDATTLQFRKHGGYATLNGVAITPDVNNWELSTFDLTPYRGQSVKFNICTAVGGSAGGLNAESKFDCFVVNRSITTDLSTVTVTATGEVAYYKLDASTGTVATDNSGNENQGTLVNGPVWVAGQVNNALSFDGTDDYVNCGNGAGLNIGAVGQSYSVSAWFKTSILKDQSISEKWLSSGGTYPYCLRGPNGGGSGLRFAAYDGTNNPCAFDASQNYADGVWHYVVGVRDAAADMVRIYVDGVLKGEVNDNTVGNLQNSASVVVGRRHADVASCQFNGLLDEVRIYNKALSGYEVQALYMQGSLAASWKFDEISGTTANDISGYSNMGTLTYMDPATDWVTGKYGKALDFDGSNDYVNAGNPASLKITGSQTIAMWIYPHGFTARRNPYNKAYGGEGTITVETTGKVNYYYGTYGGNGGTYQGFTMTSACAANTWTHLAIVRDLSSMKLRWYKNGALTNEATALYAAAKASSNNVWIGRGYAGYFDGLIDELRVYNSALSEKDVRMLYQLTHSITGKVNPALSGVTVTAGDLSSVTDASGNYTITGLLDGAYTVIPRFSGYTFSPGSSSQVVKGADITGVNFTASVWFDPGWCYKTPVNVTGSATVLTDYQVLVTVETASLVAAGKMRSDCADIRFTDSDNVTSLSYWLESGANSAATRIWVKVPAIPTGGKTIFMYYGNPSAAYSNTLGGTNTFCFFDDFEDYAAGATLIGQNGWTNAYGTNNGNILVVSDQYSNGGKSLRATSSGYSRQDAEHTFSGITDFVCEYDIRTDKSLSETYYWVFYTLYDTGNPITTMGFGRQYDGLGNKIVYWNGTAYNALLTYTQNTWYNVKVTGHFSTKTLDISINGEPKVTGGSFSNSLAASFNKISFDVYGSENAWLDAVRVRKYASSEPSATLGAEETSGKTNVISEIPALVHDLPAITQSMRCAPNPFTDQTIIKFQLAASAQTTIKVYNIMGQEVKTLVNKCLRPGFHSVKWDGKSDNGQKVAAGVYLYRMEAGEYSKTNKMTVLR